ncbi:hypothetical protein GCM10023063_24130 [Arthrobacter methylotrophus]
MNRSELNQILLTEGFYPFSYDLNGGPAPEAHILENRGYEWAVYYSERGDHVAEEVFFSESEACEFFLDRMRSDPSTRPRAERPPLPPSF